MNDTKNEHKYIVFTTNFGEDSRHTDYSLCSCGWIQAMDHPHATPEEKEIEYFKHLQSLKP